MPRRKFTREFKLSAVNLVNQQGYVIPSATQSLGVDPANVRTLEVRFKKVIGQTIYSEIQKARIEKAKHLLVESTLPISQVISSLQFSEPKRFYAIFRKFVKMSLSQYRRKSSGR